jgi:hypothetical protein
MTATTAYKFAKSQYQNGKFVQFKIVKSDVCDVYWLEGEGVGSIKAFASYAEAEAAKNDAMKRAAKFI